MKVLFLDDDPNRREYARAFFANDELSVAETAQQAIKMLDKYSPYDFVSLDHDLGGKVYCPSDEQSGYHVATHICQMAERLRPKRVRVHSYNAPAALRMVHALEGIVPVDYQPFGINLAAQ